MGLSQDWLVEKFNLDLSLVARLGGHSQPRTHRGKERFPGMTITYALIQMLEKARPAVNDRLNPESASVCKCRFAFDNKKLHQSNPAGGREDRLGSHRHEGQGF